MKSILITGASGFIGSFLVEEALKNGFETWAAVRKSSSKEYLKDERIKFIELNFSDKQSLKTSLNGKKFDYIIHAAGATKCLKKEDFFKVNTTGTQNFIEVLQEENVLQERFVFVSSLSVYGPVRECLPYNEIRNDDKPKPNTAYGKSKLKAEQFLEQQTNFPFVILRPTGVYGPREKDYFLMAKSIMQHVDFAAGFKPQDITFIYISDLVKASFLALTKGEVGEKYFLSDGNVYQSQTFSELLQKELKVKNVIRIKAPLFILRLITLFGDIFGKIRGRITALNSDKYHILKQRNWRCDINPACEKLGFKPEINLEEGVKLSVKWYKSHGWL